MVSTARTSIAQILLRAIAAGIVGAVTIDVYLWLTTLLPVHGSMTAMWQWVASTAFGKSALGDPTFVAVGAALHLMVSIGWAAGYAYIAAHNSNANRRWIVSGIVYGLIVYTIMQTILLADNNFTYPPNPNAFVNALIAHAIFFGLPVAYVVRSMQRPAA